MVYVPYAPILPFLLVLILPLVYVLLRKKDQLKPIIAIIVCSIVTVILYPLTTVLSQSSPLFGYTIGKFIIFVFLPILTIFYLERSSLNSLKDILAKIGVHKTNMKKSVAYGLIAACVTIAITTVIIQTSQFDALHQTIMFFESFTEEFFFRGFLFLYLLSKIKSFKIAFTTSILAFIFAHPQHFISPFLISTAAQAILMTIVTHKTKNITGPWIGHGLNRVVPALIRSFLG
ncbi:MAG: CPBP family intramembrane metalloprotease [Candidatus Aenigmarchaeota archaeon]|nr:CPBP family intramembrane metalloprotease [Candidatus Aenigmarchaeota archaeon]